MFDKIDEHNKQQIENAQRLQARKSFSFPLGRLIAPDKRDYDYPLHIALALLPPRVGDVTMTRFWEPGPVLEQGSTNHCVGFAWWTFIQGAPLKTKGSPDGHEIYYRATELDEWPETNNENGTSVRAGVKALQSFGLIKQYLWAYDVQTISQYVLTQGPVIIGSLWYQSMLSPQASDGYLLHPQGALAGGHAYKLVGVDAQQRVFKVQNSWGEWWGNKGFAYITFDELQRLLSENGEAVAAIEQEVIVGSVR